MSGITLGDMHFLLDLVVIAQKRGHYINFSYKNRGYDLTIYGMKGEFDENKEYYFYVYMDLRNGRNEFEKAVTKLNELIGVE